MTGTSGSSGTVKSSDRSSTIESLYAGLVTNDSSKSTTCLRTLIRTDGLPTSATKVSAFATTLAGGTTKPGETPRVRPARVLKTASLTQLGCLLAVGRAAVNSRGLFSRDEFQRPFQLRRYRLTE